MMCFCSAKTSLLSFMLPLYKDWMILQWAFYSEIRVAKIVIDRYDNSHASDWLKGVWDSTNSRKIDNVLRRNKRKQFSCDPNWSTFYNGRERFRGVQTAFPGSRCKRERDTNLLMSSETTRRRVAGHRFSRATNNTRPSHPRQENDDERFASTRNSVDFCLHALPTMRRGNSSN